jgi:hypothetical protein
MGYVLAYPNDGRIEDGADFIDVDGQPPAEQRDLAIRDGPSRRTTKTAE